MRVSSVRSRWGIGWVWSIIGIALAGSGSARAADPVKHPNIVLILADDLGFGDLGCYGGKLVKTPNIDRLASSGIRYNQFYAGAPICSPSRTAFLTGQYPGRWHITSFLQDRAGNRACGQADFLDPKAPSLPRTLKTAGYATGHFGKWHLGGGRDVKNAPKFAAYGVDVHAGTYESPEPAPDITSTNWIFAASDKVERWDRTDFFVDKTLDFLRTNQAEHKPSFVNLWLDDPHTPWIPGPDADKAQSRKNLNGVLEDLDAQVGRLVDGINRLGLSENTLIFFISDNGPLPVLGDSRTLGFRGSKLSLYEAGIRVPMIASWPGHVPAGVVDDKTVISAVDLFPTLAAIANAQLPDGVAFDGQNLAEAITPGHPVERSQPLYFEYGRNETAYKYPGIAANRSPNVLIRDGQWTCLVNADGTGVELYDVEADPHQTTDLASKNPDQARTLADKAVQWRKSLP